MTTKQFLSGKQFNKLKINEEIFYRVIHHLGNLVTEITIFSVKSHENNEFSVDEVPFSKIPPELREQFISQEHEVDITETDLDLLMAGFEAKRTIIRNIAEEKLNVGLKRQLLAFMEIGGHYFGYVYEEGTPYTKLYHLVVDPIKKELFIDGLRPEFVPAIFEEMSPTILEKTSNLTIQIDDTVYARIARANKDTATVTVIVGHPCEIEGKETQAQFSVTMAFLMKKVEEKWLPVVIDESQKEWVEKEIQKSFETVYQELLLVVFKINGMDTLKGI